MPPARILRLLLLVWVALFFFGFLHFHLGTPSGDGFQRGANLVMAFLGWQVAALIIAIVTLIFARRQSKTLRTAQRRLARLPIWVSGLMFLAIFAIVGWAVLTA